MEKGIVSRIVVSGQRKVLVDLSQEDYSDDDVGVLPVKSIQAQKKKGTWKDRIAFDDSKSSKNGENKSNGTSKAGLASK